MTKEKSAFITLILGIFSIGLTLTFIFIWPFFPLMLTPFILFFGISGIRSERKIIAIAGIILFLVSLIIPIYSL